MSRTELQYNLQKARALATELRNVLEEINQGPYGSDDFVDEIGDHACSVGTVESWLDELPKKQIGSGSVRLTIEGFQ